MSKKGKPLLIIGAVICLSVASTITAFAGWEQTGATWKYQNADNAYFSNGWQWIDGNGDNVAECYYFNADGTILISTTTPDNFTVNENGAWVVNGKVQTEEVAGIATETTTPTQSQSNNNQGTSNNSRWSKEAEDIDAGTKWGSADWDNGDKSMGEWK